MVAFLLQYLQGEFGNLHMGNGKEERIPRVGFLLQLLQREVACLHMGQENRKGPQVGFLLCCPATIHEKRLCPPPYGRAGNPLLLYLVESLLFLTLCHIITVVKHNIIVVIIIDVFLDSIVD